MLAITKTASLRGIEGIDVTVEVDSSRGLPSFHVVGLGDLAVKEAGERVRTALLNEGYDYPKGRVTVNLYPAWIKKKGSHFDLPIAMCLLSLSGVISREHIRDSAFIGELSLEGKLIPVKGILPMIRGIPDGIRKVYVPKDNLREAYLSLRGRDMTAVGIEDICEAVDILKGKKKAEDAQDSDVTVSNEGESLDFLDVRGHWAAKEAIVTAISGGHGLLMMGPPGTGKTMLARRIPTILPDMTPDEQLETSMVYLLLGDLTKERPLILKRPFRKLTPRITEAGILGGGNEPLPGEVSLANNGVLFMDEFLEYPRSILESLRRPMEEKRINIVRRGINYQFPADFILIGAANPCRCGFYGDQNRICRCSQTELDRYRSRLSGPMTDRIDMMIELPRIDYENLKDGFSYSSREMKEKTERAFDIQKERFRGMDIRYNSQMTESMTEEFCSLGMEERELMEKAYTRYALSPRRYFKILKIARTIQDLKGTDGIDTMSLYAALGYTKYLSMYDRDDAD